ncbi:hypothetical protein Slin15195_G015980 [Septoria linicola]|uniref:Uncharacterized protein n=1 Tax=Septoria linicola TaxID=215465 RepID=A0A9Q9AIA4_9PEZI|nr:hypothetical protein Slin14017_G016040 [Septoria linicola]USW48279.1 hypothetical protein Slin15195_G015980 [Septoria linicola]
MLDLPTDLCSLPIIFPCGTQTASHAGANSNTLAETAIRGASHTVSLMSSPTTDSVREENDPPALADTILDAAEDVLQRFATSVSSSVTSKIREVCVEVLKRTEDSSRHTREAFTYDDDARFLD